MARVYLLQLAIYTQEKQVKNVSSRYSHGYSRFCYLRRIDKNLHKAIWNIQQFFLGHFFGRGLRATLHLSIFVG